MKTTLTIEDLTKVLAAMIDTNTPLDVMRAIDLGLTMEQVYYTIERIKFWRGEKMSMGQAAAKMIKEDNITDVTIILGIFGHLNFEYGTEYGTKMEKQIRIRQDDKISQALDKLADDLGGKVEIVKVNFENNDENNS